jgi:zinc protease
MRYGFVAGLGTADGVAQTLARYVAITGDVACVNETFATLDTVTPEDVKRAANTWLLPERCTVAVLHTKGKEPATAAAEGAARDASAEPAGRVSEPPVLLPVAQDPQVAFKIWFKVGSQDDPKGKEGLAALTGAMISEGGTRRMPYDKILEELLPARRGYSASVDKEMTVVSGSVHKGPPERFTASSSWRSRSRVSARTTSSASADRWSRDREQSHATFGRGVGKPPWPRPSSTARRRRR